MIDKINRKVLAIGGVCLITLLFILQPAHAQEKITGPWLWMITPTESGKGGADSIDIDSLAIASRGAVSESDIAKNGANEGERLGNFKWTLGEIAPTGHNNINECLNQIGLVSNKDLNDYSSYALITLASNRPQHQVAMRVGSDDAIKVWLNGEVVHINAINRGATDYQDTFTVDLKKGDNLLLIKVSNGFADWSMFVGIDAEIRTVYKQPPRRVDINADGVVNIQDLVLVAANFGKTGRNLADVDGNGIVDIRDLVIVAGSLGTGAAAPSLDPRALTMFTTADVQQWLSQTQHLNSTDATLQRGAHFLEQLLEALIPKETALLHNYPNPFNPETWIPYQLAKPTDVTFTIYAANGNVIRRLVLGHQPADVYQSKSRAAYWDGRNNLGERVASGVYFYQLQTDEMSLIRKMVILK